jgi:O-antigen ligase
VSPARLAVLLSLVVAGSALAFGTVEPWAREWLRFAALALFAGALFSSAREDGRARAAVAMVLPALALLLWAGLQAVPLPAGVVSTLAPGNAAVFAATVPGNGGAAIPGFLVAKSRALGVVVEPGELPPAVPDKGDRTVGRTLSLYPAATRGAILTWLTPLLVFLTAAAVARDATGRYRLLWGISLTTGLFGLIGLVQVLYWNDKLLWFRALPVDAQPFGPFVNPNHYAGFVEMGLLCTLGLVLAVIARAGDGLGLAALRTAATDREWAQPRLAILGLCALLGAAGLAGSGSRGGWIAFTVGVIGLFAVRKFRSLIPLLIVCVVLLGVGVGLFARLGSGSRATAASPIHETRIDPSFDERMDTYGRTFELLQDNLAGSGLGTFAWAYKRYQRQGEWQDVAETHNDYLQLVAETGVVGAGVLVWALAVFLLRVVRPVLRSVARPTTAGVLMAVVAMLVHSLIEFNLQIPAVHAMFATVAGVLAAAAADRLPESQENNA